MIVAAPILFVLSGLFFMNTVMYSSDSPPYLVGEVLCFGVAPLFLVLGIIVFVAAPREKKHIIVKQSKSVFSVKESPKVVNPTLLLARRIIGLILGFAFFLPPLIQGPLISGKWNFIIAMFVLLPFLTLPYLAAVLYLLSKKRPRKIDVLVIIMCTLMLLCWYVAPPLTTVVAVILIFVLLFVFVTRKH